MILLVPAVLAAALMGVLVAVRRPGHPMGTLLCAYGLASAVCVAGLAYARAAIVHFPGSLPFGVPVLWMTAWDYVPSECLGALILPLVFPDGRLLSRRWRPALDEFGLAGALRAEVARLERQPSGPSIALHVPDGDLDGLPAAVEVATYRGRDTPCGNALLNSEAS